MKTPSASTALPGCLRIWPLNSVSTGTFPWEGNGRDFPADVFRDAMLTPPDVSQAYYPPTALVV